MPRNAIGRVVHTALERKAKSADERRALIKKIASTGRTTEAAVRRLAEAAKKPDPQDLYAAQKLLGIAPGTMASAVASVKTAGPQSIKAAANMDKRDKRWWYAVATGRMPSKTASDDALLTPILKRFKLLK